MIRVHTHYDNLKVSRDAPIEVIRAAYRSLAQKHHPDLNPNNDDATRVMVAINAAYEVLNDPKRRADHDRWISSQEISKPTQSQRASAHNPVSNADAKKSNASVGENVKAVSGILRFRLFCAALVAGVFILYLVKSSDDPRPSASANSGTTSERVNLKTTDSSQKKLMPHREMPAATETNSAVSANALPSPRTKAGYVRPAVDPDGKAWPSVSSYVKRGPEVFETGLSNVTVDNTRNDADVYVKLYVFLDNAHVPVHSFYIPAFSQFTVRNLISGIYDIRYRELTSGELARSDTFNITETRTNSGVDYSNVSMTLYKVRNGNMKTHQISEAEF
jgi:hypothetical protein